MLNLPTSNASKPKRSKSKPSDESIANGRDAKHGKAKHEKAMQSTAHQSKPTQCNPTNNKYITDEANHMPNLAPWAGPVPKDEDRITAGCT